MSNNSVRFALLGGGIALGIVLSFMYRQTRFDLNHECVRSHVEWQYNRTSEDDEKVEICDHYAQVGESPTPVRTALSIPGHVYTLGPVSTNTAAVAWAVVLFPFAAWVIVGWVVARFRRRYPPETPWWEED